MATITTTMTEHAGRQAQRRGISITTIDFVLVHSDRSQKLPGHSRALWVSTRGRRRLVACGFAPADIDRTKGVRLVVDLRDDKVLTVEHMLARRAWA